MPETGTYISRAEGITAAIDHERAGSEWEIVMFYKKRGSVQKQPLLCILDHPIQALKQVLARHCAARQNRPLVRFDIIEPQTLHPPSAQTLQQARIQLATSRISSGVMHPLTSLLLTKTSKLAPRSRCSWDPSASISYIRRGGYHLLL